MREGAIVVEVPRFTFIGGSMTGVRVFGSTPAPVHSPREVGALMAREIIECTRLALRRCVELEQLLDWRSLLPDDQRALNLPDWMAVPDGTDAHWMREYFRGLANALHHADGVVAETPEVVEAYAHATRALQAEAA